MFERVLEAPLGTVSRVNLTALSIIVEKFTQ